MPKPVWSSDVMEQTVTKAGKNVKAKIDHHKPAALGRKGYPPTVPKPLVCVPVAGKRQTGPAAMDYPFA
jgi:hypothetical protein